MDRVNDDRDRRKQRLYLTEKADYVIDETNRVAAEIEEAINSRMDENDIEILFGAVSNLKKAISDIDLDELV